MRLSDHVEYDSIWNVLSTPYRHTPLDRDRLRTFMPSGGVHVAAAVLDRWHRPLPRLVPWPESARCGVMAMLLAVVYRESAQRAALPTEVVLLIASFVPMGAWRLGDPA